MEDFVFLRTDGIAERVAEDRVDLSFGRRWRRGRIRIIGGHCVEIS